MNRTSTRNRLMAGAMTVLLAAGTVLVASAVERDPDLDSMVLADQPREAAGEATSSASSGPPESGSREPAPSRPSPSRGSTASATAPVAGGEPNSGGTVAPPPPIGESSEPPTGESSPDGETGEPPPTVDAAVVTPLLRTLVFGTNLALGNVGCNLGGSVVGTVASQAGLADVLSAAILEGVSACTQLAATSVTVLQFLMESSTALNSVNPAIDPILEILATNVELLGVEYEDELAPFGETIATLGPTIRYLIGGGEPESSQGGDT